MKLYRFLLFLVFFMIYAQIICINVNRNNKITQSASSRDFITIGTGTATQRQPFGMYYGYERSASIYLGSEIGVNGQITELSWYRSSTNTNQANTKIYLKSISSSQLSPATWSSITTGATVVYNVAYLGFNSNGWCNVTLSTPFSYSSSNNLLVLCETNYGIAGSGTYPSFCYTNSSSRHQAWFQNNTQPSGNGTVNDYRPNIRLNITVSQIPSVPSNLIATAQSATQIDLNWTDNSNNETGFKLERKVGVSGAWSQIATVGTNQTTYSNTGLTAGTSYYYRVRAYNSYGDSDYSSETIVPASPSNLFAMAVSATMISLTWTDNASNETGFVVQRKTTGSWQNLSQLNSNSTNFNDSGLAPGVSYYYRVYAYSPRGTSWYSNEAIVPASPNNLTTTVVSSSMIALNWVDYASNESGFVVQRKTTGSWQNHSQLSANSTNFNDSGLASGVTYYYRVNAFTSTGASWYTNEANAAPSSIPDPPSNLFAVAQSATQIDLSWTDNSNNESGFKLERKIGIVGEWLEISTVGANQTYYINTDLVEGTSYSYRVRAYNSLGGSSYSPLAIVPESPSNLIATAVSSTMINLTWTDNASNETGYMVQMVITGNWQNLSNLGANTTSFNVSGLISGVTYYFRVYSFTSTGLSWYSNVAVAQVGIDDQNNPILITQIQGNHPNPFKSTTSIRYSVKEPGYLNLYICDVKGRLVKRLVNTGVPAGFKTETWNATDDSGKPVSSGIYYLCIKTDKYQSCKKMVLMK